MSIACVLLAAGSGRRFGGDKLLYAPDGESMLLHSLRLHEGLDYSVRMLVARPGDSAVIREAEAHGFAVIENPRHLSGIGTSAAAAAEALLALPRQPDGVLYGVCDQPFLTRETVEGLMERFRGDPTRIVAPTCGGKRGNPVLFPGGLLPEFLSLSEDVGGSAIIRQHGDLLTLFPVSDKRALMDIDKK